MKRPLAYYDAREPLWCRENINFRPFLPSIMPKLRKKKMLGYLHRNITVVLIIQGAFLSAEEFVTLEMRAQVETFFRGARKAAI